MAVIHISEADAERDFASVMARVRAGDEVAIEDNGVTVAKLQSAKNANVRLLSESLAIAKARGFTAVPDAGFADDVRSFVERHPEPLHSPWE